jgi:hypothetical protein
MPSLATLARSFRPLAVACGLALLLAGGPVPAGAVYKWVDDEGVTHLSSERPPAGVQYERVQVGSTGAKRSSGRTGSRGASGNDVRLAAVSPEQVARRNAAISELQNRECVVALEAIDRVAHGGTAVEPDEFRRLQQTADATCSRDPATRRRQEEQAAKLRVSRSDVCVEARNRLADMLEPGRRPTREQLKTQQEFIESHCKSPVR